MSSFLQRGTAPQKVFFDVPAYTPATVPLDSPIPNNVFQTWMRRRFRKEMHATWLANVTQNPQFHFHLFDDVACRAFLVAEMDARIVATYDRLLPGAYKADLWRLCILYKRGGIYMDIKYRALRPLVELFAEVTQGDTTLVREQWHPVKDVTAIYQAILIARPGDPLLLRGIERIVENVETRYYGDNVLDPTGPVMLGRCLLPSDEGKIRLQMQVSPTNESVTQILDSEGRNWFHPYSAYRLNQNMDILLYGTRQYYADMWRERTIYGD